jgi:G:T-mismatch repair DNA endonuclease (very short patch repair protein)
MLLASLSDRRALPNGDWWLTKLDRNVQRDRETDDLMASKDGC